MLFAAAPLGASSATKNIGRLQSALEALSRRVDDHRVATTLDGRMGPLTAAATNHALKTYSSAPANLKTGKLTQSQILASLTPITTYIESARSIVGKVTSGIYRPSQQQAMQTQYSPAGSPGGATPMPAPAPTYYQPSYYARPATTRPYASRGPGGLPTDRASVDIKAFIPAQYEHIRINPSLPMIVLGGIVIFMIMKDRKKKAKE